MFLADILWLLVVAVGPVLLGIAFIYALVKRRKLTKEEQARQDEATRELYREER